MPPSGAAEKTRAAPAKSLFPDSRKVKKVPQGDKTQQEQETIYGNLCSGHTLEPLPEGQLHLAHAGALPSDQDLPLAELLHPHLPWHHPLAHLKGSQGQVRRCRLVLRQRLDPGKCDDAAWCYASAWILEDVERTGISVRVSGLEAFNEAEGPFVIVANHMSTLETYLLPCILRPRFPVTFIVKRSLTTMPFFGHVMRSIPWWWTESIPVRI